MSGPQIEVEETLNSRDTYPVVMVQSEEILRVRTPAYSKTNSDISFMLRQPSASAILTNYVELVLECEFTCAQNFTVHRAVDDDAKEQAQAGTDYGYVSEGLPFQSKCIRNAVVTINGSSISHRMNEYSKEYCLLHCNRNYMEKIGAPWNDYTRQKLKSWSTAGGMAGQNNYVQNAIQAKQCNMWEAQLTDDGEGSKTNNVIRTFQIREPLFVGPFGAFLQAERFPA